MDIELPTPSRQDMGGVTRRRTDDNLPMPNQNLSAGGSAH